MSTTEHFHKCIGIVTTGCRLKAGGGYLPPRLADCQPDLAQPVTIADGCLHMQKTEFCF
jgi:hypothetical protein